jgi:hypothetical protein
VLVDWERVELVVDEQGTSVVEVELVELVGPVPVVEVVVDDDVVVLPGRSVVVVATVVVVVPGGGAPGHPNEPATDANTVPTPGKPPNDICSDWSNPQIVSRIDASSCDMTGRSTTWVDPAAGVPRRSNAHTTRHNRLRSSLA